MFHLSCLDPRLLEIVVTEPSLAALDRRLEQTVRSALQQVVTQGTGPKRPGSAASVDMQSVAHRFFTAVAQDLADGGKVSSSADELLHLVTNGGGGPFALPAADQLDLVFAACASVFEPEYEEVYRRRVRCPRPSLDSQCGGTCSLCSRAVARSRSRKTKGKRRRLQQGASGTSNSTGPSHSDQSSSICRSCCQVEELLPGMDSVVCDDAAASTKYVWMASVRLRWVPSEQWKRQFSDMVQVLSTGRVKLTFVDQAQRRAAEASAARAAAEQLKAAQPDLAASAAAAAAALAAETAAAAPSPPSTPMKKGKHTSTSANSSEDALQSSLLEPAIAYARECLFCVRCEHDDYLVRFSPQFLASFGESPFEVIHSVDRRAAAAPVSAVPAGGPVKKKGGLMNSCSIQ